jgi:hypothetical protein
MQNKLYSLATWYHSNPQRAKLVTFVALTGLMMLTSLASGGVAFADGTAPGRGDGGGG